MSFTHKHGVLLVNLGSPDSTSVSDVRRYLREFLMDGRVLDAPYLIRFFVVHCLILPRRPRQSAEAYEKIWTPQGSPLVATSKNVREQLARRFDFPIELAMRYQNPSIQGAVAALRQQGVNQLHVIPLFPHYAMSSYETAVERVKELAPDMRLSFQRPFYDHPRYVEALVASAAPALKGGFDHLLFSYHGIPERHLRKSDPTRCHCLQSKDCCATPGPAHETCYRAQCFKTAAAFVQRAGIPADRYSVSFQSRLGRDPWLKPYTDFELIRLPKTGVKKLLVICPSFVSDCLETLEEIGIRGRQSFIDSGGAELVRIPCLNEHPLWLRALEEMVKECQAQ
jgi:ferrochelatase